MDFQRTEEQEMVVRMVRTFVEKEVLPVASALDHARMLTELKREVGKLVVQTTSRVTGKVLTPEDQKRLAEETTKQLAA